MHSKHNAHDIQSELKSAVDVALLKHKKMHELAGDKSKTHVALAIIVVAALLGGLGMKLFGSIFAPSWVGVVSSTIYQSISTVVGLIVLSIVAKGLFKGKATHDGFFRVMGYGLIVSWLAFIPTIGLIGGIWGLVVLFSVLMNVHKLSGLASLGALVVSVIAIMLVHMVLTPALALVGIRGYATGFTSNDLFKDGGFKMNFKSDDGAGSFDFKDGKFTIKGEDGELMEIEVPDIN